VVASEWSQDDECNMRLYDSLYALDSTEAGSQASKDALRQFQVSVLTTSSLVSHNLSRGVVRRALSFPARDGNSKPCYSYTTRDAVTRSWFARPLCLYLKSGRTEQRHPTFSTLCLHREPSTPCSSLTDGQSVLRVCRRAKGIGRGPRPWRTT
jgi:hypothetical protein